MAAPTPWPASSWALAREGRRWASPVFLKTLVGLLYLGKDSWTWLLIGPLAG
jgi:hypothetical protein